MSKPARRIRTYDALLGDYILGTFQASSKRLVVFQLLDTFDQLAPGQQERLVKGDRLTIYRREDDHAVTLPFGVWSRIAHATYPNQRYNPKPFCQAKRDWLPTPEEPQK